VASSAPESLDDATSLRRAGRLYEHLVQLRGDQHEHVAAIDRAAVPSAVASAAVPLAMILAVTGSLLAAGTAWLDNGASAGQVGVLLLLPLSSFEAATALPAAASQYARSQAAAARLGAIALPPTAPRPALPPPPAPGRSPSLPPAPTGAPSPSQPVGTPTPRGSATWTWTSAPAPGWPSPVHRGPGNRPCCPPWPACWTRWRAGSS